MNKSKYRFEILPPQNTVNAHSLDVMSSVERVETGAANLYLVDDEGRYRWLAAQIGNCRFFRTDQEEWALQFKPLRPLICDTQPTEEALLTVAENNAQLFDLLKVSEMPIVNSGGGSCWTGKDKRT